MPLRPATRASARAQSSVEERALEELAQRRVRAIGRCPGCGGRVEREHAWLRIGEHPFHDGCAGEPPAPAPREDRAATG